MDSSHKNCFERSGDNLEAGIQQLVHSMRANATKIRATQSRQSINVATILVN